MTDRPAEPRRDAGADRPAGRDEGSRSGTSFHSLQATSHALQPMQIDVSVKNPTRSRVSAP